MANETNNMTKEERLEYWVTLEKECNSRPKDMTIVEWCEQHGITKATYYYYLRQLRAAGIGSKKCKSKSNKKSKKTTVTAPTVVEDITEVEEVTKVAEPVEEPVTELTEEPAKEIVEETPAEPIVKPVEKSITVTEPAKEAKAPAEKPVQESTSTIDITIGSTVIHVNDNTSPELLSMVVQTVVSNMKKPN